MHPSHANEDIKLLSSLINNENTLSLITIFTERGCSPCITEEIKLLNNLHTNYEQFINIYLVRGSTGYLTRMGALFRYENITNLSNPQNIHIDNPVSFLVDRNNTVQLIHKAETGNPEKSRRFFERVESLFESVYGNYYFNNSVE